ncbi:DUF6625 family protein [uncultured Subdoligranulum sp.]|uniref:DUF6625 family protein n=1 Tax=uncultured Subdoligranulum sp. TaxID=512298 RepID=UPI002619DA6D|nr:DUF6625 family protein [uncultured Subdoligranulum sp.]
MQSIAFVLAYFGDLNATGYFPLFLRSCGQNPTVDFWLFTDDHTPYDYPHNVRVRYLTLPEVRARIQAVIPYPIILQVPMDLCSFQPAFGEVFAAELAPYDFWGHIDCDLILGNVRHFVTEDILTRYDKIYSHGHMTLYLNTPAMNALYRTGETAQALSRYAFTAGELSCFDEWGRGGGINGLCLRAGYPLYDAYDFDDIDVTRRAFWPVQLRRNEPYNAMAHLCYEKKGDQLLRHCLLYGALYTAPVLYTHFQKRAMTCPPALWQAEAYLIVPDEFLPIQPVDEAFLQRLRPDGLRWSYLVRRYRAAILRRLKRWERR